MHTSYLKIDIQREVNFANAFFTRVLFDYVCTCDASLKVASVVLYNASVAVCVINDNFFHFIRKPQKTHANRNKCYSDYKKSGQDSPCCENWLPCWKALLLECTVCRKKERNMNKSCDNPIYQYENMTHNMHTCLEGATTIV